MTRLVRPVLILATVLLVPIVPFFLAGGRIDDYLAPYHPVNGVDTPLSIPAALIVGLLATDIVLPVPSSLVSTLAGQQFGALVGTLVVWLGMSLGAIAAFGLARAFGRPLARRFARQEELQSMDHLISRYGIAVLAVTRALPVLAEASVLLVGVHKLPWRRFLEIVLLCNLGIASAYAAFGNYAADHHWLPAALGVSVAVPLLATWFAQRWIRRYVASASTNAAAADTNS
jgi:uncharacterized membrane protein YdjX (TVP38/TMEM64 family)